MLDLQAKPPLDFPDDPLKWDGWSKYKAESPYERLCLDPKANPGNDQIRQHCNALLRWWQKKIRLKNQPSNPLAQLLGHGLDEAADHIIQARLQLLDPTRRLQIDNELAVQLQEEALAEFCRYVAVSVVGRVLTAGAEANLLEFGQRNGLTEEQTRTCIEEELERSKARRAAPPPLAAAPEATSGAKTRAQMEMEFHRILRLSSLHLGDATPLVREIFVTIAENLGIHLERAEHLLEDYLDEEEHSLNNPSAPSRDLRVQPKVFNAIPAAPPNTFPPAQRVQTVTSQVAPDGSPAGFINPTGSTMVLIPAGEFVMGSDATDAGPDEQPLTPVTLSEFYISRHPVTNAQYEQFEPSHRKKRMQFTDGGYPVVYVTSLEAVKYCHWLGQKDGKNYRLPTEAEWEYAARGTDGRKYPWGNDDDRAGFANFADASTTFAWRDPEVDDGYPESSPVGTFPGGASFFGLDDMGGNIWEWCLDFYQPLSGVPKRNPRGGASGRMRVLRGGSWKSRFSNMRATARSSNAANYSSNDVGFRIVCECGASDSQ